MVRMDSFSSVPPHIEPPMAQVPSAIRELIRFVPLISIYSCMLSLVLSCSWVSQAAQHAGWDAIAMGQVFQFVELRLWFVYLLLQNFNASFGGDSDIAFIEAYSTRCFPEASRVVKRLAVFTELGLSAFKFIAQR